MNSDHWPIDGSLLLERKELWCTVNHEKFSQRGWAPKTDEAKQIFMRGVAKDLCWMNEEARSKALVSVEEIIYSHAFGINSDNSAIRQWSGRERPQILGRICDMALRRHVERRIYQIVQGGLSEQHAVETPSFRQIDLLGTTFHAILGRRLDTETEGLQHEG